MNEKDKEEKQKFYVVGDGKSEEVSEEVFKKEMHEEKEKMSEFHCCECGITSSKGINFIEASRPSYVDKDDDFTKILKCYCTNCNTFLDVTIAKVKENNEIRKVMLVGKTKE